MAESEFERVHRRIDAEIAGLTPIEDVLDKAQKLVMLCCTCLLPSDDPSLLVLATVDEKRSYYCEDCLALAEDCGFTVVRHDD